MPYIIITNPCRCADRASDWHDFKCPCYVTDSEPVRRAVATLEEARYGVAELLDDLYGDREDSDLDALHSITEEGGAAGPLPDGTIIEVEPMVWRGGPIESESEARAMVDAYNAGQSAS